MGKTPTVTESVKASMASVSWTVATTRRPVGTGCVRSIAIARRAPATRRSCAAEALPATPPLWVKPQPAGQRPEDLVDWVCEHYPDLVAERMNQ